MSQRRTRFGLLRDKKTRKPIPRRPKGGDCVYKQQGCRRCGVDVRKDACACEHTRRADDGTVLSRRPMPPRPGRIFAAFTNGKTA